jgi:hypothetical protein
VVQVTFSNVSIVGQAIFTNILIAWLLPMF